MHNSSNLPHSIVYLPWGVNGPGGGGSMSFLNTGSTMLEGKDLKVTCHMWA